MQKPRNNGIELLRVLSMIGVCMIHAVAFEPSRSGHWLSNMLRPCVVVFVLISGYFGIRFSISKIIRLCLVGLYCSTMASVLDRLLVGCGFDGLAMDIINTYKSFWFLHAYLVLMAFACLCGGLFEVRDGDGSKLNALVLMRTIPVVLVVFFWSFFAEFPVIYRILPKDASFGPYSGLTLVGIYLAGRLVRVVGFDTRNMSVKKAFLVVILLFGVSSFGLGWFGWYNSPAALVLASLLLIMFSRLNLPKSLAFFVELVAPSCFSIYLMTTNDVGRLVVERVLLEFHDWLYVGFAVSALVLFMGGLLLDTPRRIVARINCLNLWGSMDRVYSNGIVRLTNLIGAKQEAL